MTSGLVGHGEVPNARNPGRPAAPVKSPGCPRDSPGDPATTRRRTRRFPRRDPGGPDGSLGIGPTPAPPRSQEVPCPPPRTRHRGVAATPERARGAPSLDGARPHARRPVHGRPRRLRRERRAAQHRRTSLQLSSGDYQWTVSAYVLLSGGLLLLGGRLADLVRPAPDVPHRPGPVHRAPRWPAGWPATALALILARAAQGAGAAMLTPAAMSIVMTTYAGRQRATALGRLGDRRQHGHRRRRALRRRSSPARSTGARCSSSTCRSASPCWSCTLRTVARARRSGRPAPASTSPARPPWSPACCALVLGIEEPAASGWTAPRTSVAFGRRRGPARRRSRVLERRVAQPLVPPRIWRVRSLVVGLGGDGRRHRCGGRRDLPELAVPAAGRSARPRSSRDCSSCRWPPRSPLARRRRLQAAAARRRRALIADRAAGRHGRRGAAARHRRRLEPTLTDVLPGFLLLGAGVGPMFVAISVGAMSDVPRRAVRASRPG